MTQIGEGVAVPVFSDAAEETEDEERPKHQVAIGAKAEGPSDWIGHAYVSVEYPKGSTQTVGFWPRNGFDLGEKPDRKGVVFGMPGAVLDDSEYLVKPLGPFHKRKAFLVDEAMAKKAYQKIEEYRREPPQYTLWGQQCARFAVTILRAAGVDLGSSIVPRPRSILKALGGTDAVGEKPEGAP